MKIFKDINKWKKYKNTLPADLKIGLVPTMGALHEGHLSLIRKSISENQLTVVTIFLNPTQFNNPEDLEKYPQTWSEDVDILKGIGADILLAPTFEQLYPDDYQYKITENSLSKLLCGTSRPGHFDGVLTIVMKLLNIVKADKAYFGEKDYQQLQLVKKMCKTFFIDTAIVECPIIREHDSLAMSSRNRRLSNEGRKLASEYVKLVRQNKEIEVIKEELSKKGIKVDYLEDRFERRFVAVVIDNIRLIDNFKLNI